MVDISALQLPAWIPAQVYTLVALILADVLLAVGAALQTNNFQWRKLPEFYEKKVLPLLVGWVAFSVLVKYGSKELLGNAAPWASDGLVAAAWLRIVGLLGSSIVGNIKAIYTNTTISSATKIGPEG